MAKVSKNRDVLTSPTMKASSGYGIDNNPQIRTSQSSIPDDAGMSAKNSQSKAVWASGVPSKKGNKPQ